MSLDRGTYCKLIYLTIQEGPDFLGMSMPIWSEWEGDTSRQLETAPYSFLGGNETAEKSRQTRERMIDCHFMQKKTYCSSELVSLQVSSLQVHTQYVAFCFVLGVMCYQAHPLLESRTFSILHEIAGKQVSTMRSLPPRRSLFGSYVVVTCIQVSVIWWDPVCLVDRDGYPKRWLWWRWLHPPKMVENMWDFGFLISFAEMTNSPWTFFFCWGGHPSLNWNSELVGRISETSRVNP